MRTIKEPAMDPDSPLTKVQIGEAVKKVRASRRWIELHIPYEFPLLVCPNPQCEHRFVLIAILDEDGDWITQADAYFCPYCGEKWRK